MKAVALIPARLESSRFPEKMLADLAGKALIVRTHEAVAKSGLFSDVLVVTDHVRILELVEAHGGKAVMSAAHHQSGSDRIAEIAARLEADFLVNIQGDEPFTSTQSLACLLEQLAQPGVEVASLMCPIYTWADFENPNVVKVVCNRAGDALYFSRAPIPFPRDVQEPRPKNLPEDVPIYQHIGIYGYKREALLRFTALPPAPLEQLEKLEQLRLLYHGIPIRMGLVHEKSLGIDTEEDLAKARLRFMS
ncbi:MAG: 3-deoxy-manno-octulosonate cytidylyltransferase [Bacteroidia bacterium]